MKVAKLVHYWGRVQGVGFRYGAVRVAAGCAVAGYVRNLPDGQVELWAEGEAAEVEKFLAGVARQMAGYIVGQKVVDETAAGLTEFVIRN